MLRNSIGSVTVSSCCAACALLLALIFTVAAIAVPDWESGVVSLAPDAAGQVERNLGLWEVCGQVLSTEVTSNNCISWSTIFDSGSCQDLKISIQSQQALSILSSIMLLLCICLILAGALIHNVFILAYASCMVIMAVLCQITVLALWIATVVEKEHFQCRIPSNILLAKSEVCPGCDVSAGWVLMLLSVLLCLVALCATCAACCLRKRRPPLKPPVSSAPVSAPFAALPVYPPAPLAVAAPISPGASGFGNNSALYTSCGNGFDTTGGSGGVVGGMGPGGGSPSFYSQPLPIDYGPPPLPLPDMGGPTGGMGMPFGYPPAIPYHSQHSPSAAGSPPPPPLSLSGMPTGPPMVV